jgi:predicted ATPase
MGVDTRMITGVRACLTFTQTDLHPRPILTDYPANSALCRGPAVAVVAHALYGLGGVGKTQLALEYAHRYAADYDLTWWIPAENPVTIADTLAQLGPRLGLDAAVVERDRLVPAVLDSLRKRDRWLLVFDNAEQPDDIAPFQPAGGRGHLLLTSRNPAWGAIAKTMRVDVLPHDQAIELLLRRWS